MTQQVKTLSEGQGLLSLACLNLQEPSILIMDEPTNHSTSIRINEHLYVNYLVLFIQHVSNHSSILLFISY
jgi:ABC-type cobalamin/Fe3+-siderophores transport system ATPase subunit